MDRQWDGTLLSRTMQRSMTVREKARHVVRAMMVSRVKENQLVRGNDFASQPSNWFQPLEVMLPGELSAAKGANWAWSQKIQTQIINTNTITITKAKKYTLCKNTIAECSWSLSTALSGALLALSVTRKKTNATNSPLVAFLYYNIFKWKHSDIMISIWQYFYNFSTLIVSFLYCKYFVNKPWEI